MLALTSPSSVQAGPLGIGRIRGLTFRHWLLLAFVGITAPLGAAAVQALFTLDHAERQSRETAQHAVSLSTHVQRLAERTVAMERSARQFLVLDDASFRERFSAAWQDARATQELLYPALPQLPVTLKLDWATQAESAWSVLQMGKRQRQAALQSLTPVFARLHKLNDDLDSQSRQELDRRSNSLLTNLDQQRRLISGLVLSAIALAVMLAFGLGHWLSRPMARIEAVIARLGDNQFDQPVDIRGPVDLRRLGLQLDWLRRRLATLESDKIRFVRHISHELKTPLASIREGAALLSDGVAGTLTRDQTEIVRILSGNAATLQGQIEDLLRLHALASEAHQLRRQPVDLRKLVQQVAETQRLHWQAKGLTLSVVGDSAAAMVDADKLSMALSNLLSNAVRFSPAGSCIQMNVAQAGGRTTLDCIDQGPGVAAEDAERIFEPFFQGRQQAPGARQGSGIGLSIVREVVLMHGGAVGLMPSQYGAHFRIELPHEISV